MKPINSKQEIDLLILLGIKKVQNSHKFLILNVLDSQLNWFWSSHPSRVVEASLMSSSCMEYGASFPQLMLV